MPESRTKFIMTAESDLLISCAIMFRMVCDQERTITISVTGRPRLAHTVEKIQKCDSRA